MVCKPFKKSYKEQLKLVSSFEWINFVELSDVRVLILKTFAEEGISDYVDETRVKAICDTIQKSIRDLFEMSMDYIPSETTSTKNDVEENIAEDYGTKKLYGMKV